MESLGHSVPLSPQDPSKLGIYLSYIPIFTPHAKANKASSWSGSIKVSGSLGMNLESQKELSKAEYWEQRYKTEESLEDGKPDEYEWFKTYTSLKPFLTKHMTEPQSNPRILHLGCGTSVSDFRRLGIRAY